MVSTASGAKTEGKFTGQFLWNGGIKTNPFATAAVVALLEIRIISKNEHNRFTLQGVIAKIMYPAKCPKKRGDRCSEPSFNVWTT